MALVASSIVSRVGVWLLSPPSAVEEGDAAGWKLLSLSPLGAAAWLTIASRVSCVAINRYRNLLKTLGLLNLLLEDHRSTEQALRQARVHPNPNRTVPLPLLTVLSPQPTIRLGGQFELGYRRMYLQLLLPALHCAVGRDVGVCVDS